MDGVRSAFYDVFFIEGTVVCVLVDGAGFHLFEGQCSVHVLRYLWVPYVFGQAFWLWQC